MAKKVIRVQASEGTPKPQRPKRNRQIEREMPREIRTPDLTLINRSDQPFNDLEVAELAEAWAGLGPVTMVKLGRSD